MTTPLVVTASLLADFDTLSGAGRYLRSSGDPVLRWLFFLGVLLIAAVWGGLFLWDRWSKRLRRPVDPIDPGFASLCQAHRLEKSERTLLWRVARGRADESPLTVFLDPTLLETFATNDPAERTAAEELRTRLFGGDRVAVSPTG